LGGGEEGTVCWSILPFVLLCCRLPLPPNSPTPPLTTISPYIHTYIYTTIQPIPAAKEAKKIAAHFGYTAHSNPFGDANLHQQFVWKVRAWSVWVVLSCVVVCCGMKGRGGFGG
jgi:hypothetical protein